MNADWLLRFFRALAVVASGCKDRAIKGAHTHPTMHDVNTHVKQHLQRVVSYTTYHTHFQTGTGVESNCKSARYEAKMVSSLVNRWSTTHPHMHKFRMAASSACWEKLTFSTSHTSVNIRFHANIAYKRRA